MATAHEFQATGIDGSEVDLSMYAGKVLLVVNVASRCGFTPQYAGLQQLWRDYRERGLVVLGSPATSSATRSRATRRRSGTSARSTTGSISRCSPRSRSTA